MESLAATSLVSVELQVLSFCLRELDMIMPLPRDAQNPEWPWAFGCVLWEPSTHQFTLPVPSLHKMSGRSGVAWRYCIMWHSFFQSSWSGHVTHVERKATAVARSGHACLVKNNALAMKVWKTAAALLERGVASLLTWKRCNAAGVLAVVLVLSCL